MRPERLVEFLEAAYAVDMEDEPWLLRVSTSIRDVWGRPGAIFSSFYDASDLEVVRPTLLVTEGIPKDLVAILLGANEFVTPELIVRIFQRSTAGTVRQIAPEIVPVLSRTTAFGLRDSLAIIGGDLDGFGCSVTVGSRAPIAVEEERMEVHQRMAFHLGAAFRCRRRLRDAAVPVAPSVGAEAVIHPSGRVLHAEGPAKRASALADLTEAARRFDSARSRGRDSDPIVRLARHHPLVDARWTLVDAYERGGARYIVARENQAAVRGLALLTDRERQVVGFLVLGRTTKEISYALGISDSTTRVLLSRAALRLRARTRQELVRLATLEILPTPAGPPSGGKAMHRKATPGADPEGSAD